MLKRLITFASSLVLLMTLLTPTVFAVRPFDTACTTGNNPSDSTLCNPSSGINTVNDPISGKNGDGIIVKAIQLLIMLTGIAAVIVIIVAGIRFATSSGDPSSINQAKNTIMYAVIGLAVALLSQAIITFVVKRF